MQQELHNLKARHQQAANASTQPTISNWLSLQQTNLLAMQRQALADLKAKDQQISFLTADAACQRRDAALEAKRLHQRLQDMLTKSQQTLTEATAKDDEIAALKPDAAAHHEAANNMRRVVKEMSQQHKQALAQSTSLTQQLQIEAPDTAHQQPDTVHNAQRLEELLQDVQMQQHQQAVAQVTAKDQVCSKCAALQGQSAKLELALVDAGQATSRLRHKLRSKRAQHNQAVSELAAARSIAAQRYDALLGQNLPVPPVPQNI